MTIISTIFDEMKLLEENYPNLPGVKSFDLHKKHLFYGRIDDEGDAIYLDDPQSIQQLQSGKTSTHLAVDFVCDAFADLKTNLRSASNKGYFPKAGLYPANLTVHRSWAGRGDLHENYNRHLNNLYTRFVDSYLSIDRRFERIKNFKDFVSEFLKFSLRTIKNFPVTRTGFLTSTHCSPFVSGLMIEIQSVEHGPTIKEKVDRYIEDENGNVNGEFLFWVNEVKKFGFMVDKNAPWRLVFNLASGQKNREDDPNDLKGGQIYMDRRAASYENVFKTYYRKAYLDEFVNLRAQMFSLYESFYLQYNTYESIKYVTSEDGRCDSIKIFTERKDREPLSSTGIAIPETINMSDAYEIERIEHEFWLKVILKLRLEESQTYYEPHRFKFLLKEATQHLRLFGIETALKKINDLTKGFDVTNFLVRGDYWYGLSEKEYQERKLLALEELKNPSLVQYSLTGTKNIR